MTHRSPLATLVGLVVLFAVMFGVNVARSAPRQPEAVPAPTASASAAPTSVSPRPTPTPTPSQSSSAAKPTSPFPDKVVYAGRTEDDSASVAVAVLNGRAAAYLCDGREVEAWLKGTVDGDTVSLTGKEGAKLSATLAGSTLRGSVEVDGEVYDFKVKVAKKPAGLYRAKGSKTTIGWIVLPDGSQVGLQTSDSGSTPAPPLDPEGTSVGVDGETLEAEPVAGDEDI